nr:hypothetical protein Q903MT_gene4861 [Picea sitchensis]
MDPSQRCSDLFQGFWDITLPLHTGGTTSPTSPIITTPDEWLNLAFLRW